MYGDERERTRTLSWAQETRTGKREEGEKVTEFNYKPNNGKMLVAVAKHGAGSTIYVPNSNNVSDYLRMGKVMAVADDINHQFKVGNWVEVPQAVIINQGSDISIMKGKCPEWEGLNLFWCAANQVIGTITFPEGMEPGLLTREDIERSVRAMEAIEKQSGRILH